MNVLITDNPLDVVGYDLVIDLRTDKKIDSKNAISIFSIVEENADAIRRGLSSLIHLTTLFLGIKMHQGITEFKAKIFGK